MARDLDREFRQARGRLGAHIVHSRHAGEEITANARAAGPGSLAYWRRKIDPELVLDADERERRARHAKAAFYARLAMQSAAARRRKSP